MGIFTNSIHPALGESVNQEGGIIAVKSLSYNTSVTSTSNIAASSSTPTISQGVNYFQLPIRWQLALINCYLCLLFMVMKTQTQAII